MHLSLRHKGCHKRDTIGNDAPKVDEPHNTELSYFHFYRDDAASRVS